MTPMIKYNQMQKAAEKSGLAVKRNAHIQLEQIVSALFEKAIVKALNSGSSHLDAEHFEEG